MSEIADRLNHHRTVAVERVEISAAMSEIADTITCWPAICQGTC